ncbi:MAG TPA: TIR domain-containing protein [Longimicrobium sp.]|nr:TIR domain-containing protein [Longimicrobium sp.]
MQRHVFISHSAKDAALAHRIAAALRSAGARTWMAPGDINPGEDWGAAIATAIADCAAMILVLTAHSNGSKQVVREVQLADAANHPIIPLRMEALELSPSLKYFLSASQWLDATTSSEEEMLRELVESVRERAPETAVSEIKAPPGPDPSPAAPDLATWIRAVLRTPFGMVAAALATVGAAVSVPQLLDTPSGANEPAGDSTLSETPVRPNDSSSAGRPTVSGDTMGADTQSATPERRFRPLRIGISVGGITQFSGTLGAFARDRDGARYLLMAMHSTAESDFRVGAPIIQPAAADGGQWPRDEIGAVARLLPLEDRVPAANLIALVRVKDGIEIDPRLRGGTTLRGVRADGGDLLGETVRAYGSQSGEATGQIRGVSTSISLRSPVDSAKSIWVDGFLAFGKVFQPGDPGALVVDSANRAVGLILAGNDERTFIAPLEPALREFRVELLTQPAPATGGTR